jgi:hypothetical protein
VKFLVIKCPSAYNVILGRPTLNTLGAVVSTLHMAIKFPRDRDDIITVRGKTDTKKDPKGKKFTRRDSAVMMTDLDLRGEFQHQRPKLEGSLVEIQIGNKTEQVMKVGKSLLANLLWI